MRVRVTGRNVIMMIKEKLFSIDEDGNISIVTQNGTEKRIGSFIKLMERRDKQLAGIEKAKVSGKYKGRKPTALIQKDAIIKSRLEGKPVEDICKSLAISRASVFRVLKQAGVKANRLYVISKRLN